MSNSHNMDQLHKINNAIISDCIANYAFENFMIPIEAIQHQKTNIIQNLSTSPLFIAQDHSFPDHKEDCYKTIE